MSDKLGTEILEILIGDLGKDALIKEKIGYAY